MGSQFTFYDYIDAEGSGTNIIKDWLNSEGKEAKARFNRMISYLEESPPAGYRDSVWCDPYVWPLRNEWKGFKEIRKKVKGVQYRLIGKVVEVKGVRNVYLVTWGYHVGKWAANITVEEAIDRVNKMNSEPDKYRIEHENS